LKDFDDSVVVLAVPRGCEARTLREYFESYPAVGIAVADVEPEFREYAGNDPLAWP
jgi:hypothetical protein